MKRHPTDLVSLVLGLFAVGVAVLALSGGLTLDVIATDWVWPAVLIALGLLVLASAGLGRRRPAEQDAGTEPTPTSSLDDTVEQPRP